MKTAEELAQEYCNQERATRSEYAAYIAGWKERDRWIPVEEGLPELRQDEGYRVLAKKELNGVWFSQPIYENTDIEILKKYMSHWKYID